MLSQQIIDQLQPYDFDRLARKESDGHQRLRLIALAHLKEGKSCSEVGAALHACRHAVMRWVQWFIAGGVARLAGMPHDWSTQRLAKEQEEAFRQAVEQLQRERGGGRVRGEDIRQLLARQFGVAYSFNGVYDLLKRLAWCGFRPAPSVPTPIRWPKPNSKKNFVQEVAATLPPGVEPEQVDIGFQG